MEHFQLCTVYNIISIYALLIRKINHFKNGTFQMQIHEGGNISIEQYWTLLMHHIHCMLSNKQAVSVTEMHASNHYCIL